MALHEETDEKRKIIIFEKFQESPIEKRTPSLVFSCEFWDIFNNDFFIKYLRVTASDY